MVRKPAKYRRQLTKDEYNAIREKYQGLFEKSTGGLFQKIETRSKVVGQKGEKIMFTEDTSNFWYRIRERVKYGLADLQLLCEVAHENQMKWMFDLTKWDDGIYFDEETMKNAFDKDRKTDVFTTDIVLLLRQIITDVPELELIDEWVMADDYEPPKKVTGKDGKEIDDPDFKPKMKRREARSFHYTSKAEDIIWRAEIVQKVMQECMIFLRRNQMLTTLAHKRVAEEMEDVIKTEIYNRQAKGNIPMKKVAGL